MESPQGAPPQGDGQEPGMGHDTGTFVLDTDASRVAISGILHQWQKVQGKDRLVVINYASRGLKGSERKYSAARSGNAGSTNLH